MTPWSTIFCRPEKWGRRIFVGVSCALSDQPPRPACGERVGVRGKPLWRGITALRGKDQERVDRARSLRRALTPAELTLWMRIRCRRLGGYKFARQEPIGRYYVDLSVVSGA